jgi:hypothetical protein
LQRAIYKLESAFEVELIEKVRHDGEFDDLFLWVDPNNPAFNRFYPLFGFVEFDRITDSGDGREWVLMHKSLTR